MNSTTSSALSVPQTQNTAPVLEFRCLYTADLKRKQKRWQDGRLKFHTFNKRVMVYDDRANFVGDTHWKGADFGEGEELQLERGGVLVEVSECIGKRDQDLSELVDKRVKDREERNAAKIAQDSPVWPSAPGLEHSRPRTLNEVIGTPTGHFGRAMVSNLSPFEQKQQTIQNTSVGDRPAKRRKQMNPPSSRSGYAQNLVGVTLTLSSTTLPNTAPIHYGHLRPSIRTSQTNTIDLTSDEMGPELAGRAEQRPLSSPTRIQRRNPKMSVSTANSGYASSLTGAKLSLNTPGSCTINVVDAALAKKGFAIRRRPGTDSSSPEENNSRGLRDSLESTKTMSAHFRPRDTDSSAEPEESQETTKTKPHHLEHQTTLNSSRTEPMKAILSTLASDDLPAPCLNANRCVTALRIKPRAPPKMMMLMELPSSRSSTPIYTARRNRLTPNHPSMGASIEKEVEISQINVQANSIFHAGVERSSSDLADLSSSPVDGGIDHETIDALRSRKSILPLGKIFTLNSERVVNGESLKIETAAKCPQIASESKAAVAQERNKIIEKEDLQEPEPAVSPTARENQSDVASSMVNMRRIIPNPATRGQSVQTLASKTLDAAAPSLTNMVPPRIIPARSKPGEDTHGGASGPWSRESFDLFGTWKPPDREHSTSITS